MGHKGVKYFINLSSDLIKVIFQAGGKNLELHLCNHKKNIISNKGKFHKNSAPTLANPNEAPLIELQPIICKMPTFINLTKSQVKLYEWKCCFKESGPTVKKDKRTQNPFNSVPSWLISFSDVTLLLQ